MKSSSVTEKIHAQYIIDEQGNKTGVILKMEIFEKLLEELEDLHLGKMAEAALNEDQETHNLEDVKQEIFKKNNK
ncbi:MAG: hypothetical protein V1855_02800 [bacterium]